MVRRISPTLSSKIEDGERVVAVRNAWLVEDAVADPCTVVLTDRQLVVDVRPITFVPRDPLIVPLRAVAKVGWQSPPRGIPIRLVVVCHDGDRVRSVALELPPGFRGRRFAQRVVRTTEAEGARRRGAAR
jgi:hypothetical protein